jgi:hypothetical protein
MDPITTIIEAAILRFGADVAKEIKPLGLALLQVIQWQHELEAVPVDHPHHAVLEGNVQVAREIVMEHYARIEGMLGNATVQPIIAAVLGALAAIKNDEGGEA